MFSLMTCFLHFCRTFFQVQKCSTVALSYYYYQLGSQKLDLKNTDGSFHIFEQISIGNNRGPAEEIRWLIPTGIFPKMPANKSFR